jgi:hypothetical protein
VLLPAHQKAIVVTTVIPISKQSHHQRLARRRTRLLGGSTPASASTPAVSGHAVAEAMASKPRATPMAQQRSLPDAATTIGIAMHWSRRRGRRLSALPELIRSQLELLCEAGDPAARLVRNWLVGHGPFDPEQRSPDHAAHNLGGVNDAG